LSYADAFEHLSRPKAGVATPTPREIHAKISAECGISIEVLRRLETFLESTKSETSDPASSQSA
jgi:hypothetical protein